MATRYDERAGGPALRTFLAGTRFLGRNPDGLPAKAGARMLMRLPLPELVFENRDGYRMLAHPRDQMEAYALLGRYRLPENVMRLVRPGDWVIDAGANVGIISSQLCAVVGQAGLVSAWEPIERNVERLRFLKEENGLEQLSIVPHAAGHENATISIGLGGEGRSGWNSITASWVGAEKVDVTLRRPDELGEPPGEGKTLRLIKLDVEGFELEALEGCRGLLERHAPWIYCEFNDVVLRDRGSSAADLLELLASLGYEPAEPVPDFEGKAENLLLRSERSPDPS